MRLVSDFRVLTDAAPLKHRTPDRPTDCPPIGFPRSHGRGSVEAAIVSLILSPPISDFRVLTDAAPLKLPDLSSSNSAV